jgi:AcrR family transcriptional regulator
VEPTAAQQRILDAAATCFAERGFHGTSTRDIARQAGLSPAVLYVHYPSKEDVLFEISRRGHEHALARMREAGEGQTGPAAILAATTHAFALWHAREHTVARIVNYELAALSPEHFPVIAELRRAIEREMRDVVAAGIVSGEFHSDRPEATSLAILSLAIDLGRWFRDEGEWTPENVAEHYAQLALRMVGADLAAATVRPASVSVTDASA